jgi:hypothetical protein
MQRQNDQEDRGLARTPRYSPPVNMIKLTKDRQIDPSLWVHPDEER